MEFHEVVSIWPKMQDDEFKKLVNDVKSNGLREDIWTYQNKIIDGRHRYLACIEAHVTPRYREWDGQGSLTLFVASLNQHRRHLDAGQKAFVALKVEEELAKEAKQQKVEAGKLYGEGHSKPQEVFQSFEKPLESIRVAKPIHAAKQAAAITGSNTQYVVDAKKIVERAPELREAVMNRTVSLPEAKKLAIQEAPIRQAVIAKVVSNEVKNVKEAMASVRQEQKAEEAKTVTLPQSIQLLHGDFRILGSELLDESIDLIFTDPPYHEEHLTLWSDLASLANRVLKPGGMLLAYSGQIFLPQVLQSLSEHLTYCWLLGVAHSGGHIQIWKHSIWNDWKPIVMFSKGKPVEHDWLMDLYRGDKGDKEAHEWSQGEGEAAYFIEKLTHPGGIVVDPMCGSGTILRAAHKLKRTSFGMEIDNDRYTVALAGMKDVVRV
jgi:hypothetical protein